MKSLSSFLLLLCLVCSTSAKGQNDSAVARFELQRLNEAFGYKAPMTISRTGAIRTESDGAIHMSLEELQKISSVKDKRARLYLTRFIVCHEFAHHVQLFKYRDSASHLLSSDNTAQTLIEAQADLMAAFMFMQISPEIPLYLQSHQGMMDSLMRTVLQSIYNLGIREHTIGTHPSKRARLIAMVLGFYNGAAYHTDMRIKNSDKAKNATSETDLAKYKSYMNRIFYYLDLSQSEDLLAWSYRQARKIVHHDRKAARGIVLLTPYADRYKFIDHPQNPSYQYKLSYQNLQAQHVEVEMEVYVESANDVEPGELEPYTKLNVVHHKFTMAPGETKTLSGVIDCRPPWNMSEPSQWSLGAVRLVFPTYDEDDAMYSCSYSSGGEPIAQNEEIPFFRAGSSQNPAVSFRPFLLKLANLCRTQLASAVSGLGSTVREDKGIIAFPSSIQYEEGTTTLLLYDMREETEMAETHFHNYYPNSEKLDQKYAAYKSIILDEFPDAAVHEQTAQKYPQLTCINKDLIITLEKIRNESAKAYTLRLTMRANE